MKTVDLVLTGNRKGTYPDTTLELIDVHLPYVPNARDPGVGEPIHGLLVPFSAGALAMLDLCEIWTEPS